MDSTEVYALLYKKGLTAEDLEKAYSGGLIRKEKLIDGKIYKGHCRNASEAIWDASKGCFTYQRTKFGDTFPEDIPHPADDEGFDIFVAVEEENNND